MTILEAIKQHLVIHCGTMSESDRILGLLHTMGVKYHGGMSLVEENYWSDYREETCYNVGNIPINDMDLVIDNEWKYYGLSYQEKYYFEVHSDIKRKIISSKLIK